MAQFNQEDLNELKRLTEHEQTHGEALLASMQKLLQQHRYMQNPLQVQHLIAVHLTNYFPEGGVIKTAGQFLTAFDDYWQGKRHVQLPRETIHFSLNGTVSAHGGGNWEGAKYAILIPLAKIADRVQYLNPQDSWIFGELILPPGTDIIGKEQDLVGKNPGAAQNVSITGTLKNAVVTRIKERGYAPMDIGQWSWHAPATPEDYEIVKNMWGASPYGGIQVDWNREFTVLAEALGKGQGSHQNSLLGQIEDEAMLAYQFLWEKDTRIELVRGSLKNLLRHIGSLREFEPLFESPEEKTAHHRLIQLLVKLCDELSHTENLAA